MSLLWYCRSRRILSQQVHEYSKQILWQTPDSDEEGKPLSPRKRLAAGHLECLRVPLLPVQSSTGAQNVAQESSSTSHGHGAHAESNSDVVLTAAQNVDQQVRAQVHGEADAVFDGSVRGEASPAKQSPLSSTDVVPDTPTSSCGRPSAGGAPPFSTNLVRAALQRAAAQHVEQQLMQAMDAPGSALAGPVPGSNVSHDAAAHHEAGPLPAAAQATANVNMPEQEEKHTSFTALMPWPARAAALQAPVLHGAVQLVGVSGSVVELAALDDMSPYDVRMLAHLKRLDQKAAAMKVTHLAAPLLCMTDGHLVPFVSNFWLHGAWNLHGQESITLLGVTQSHDGCVIGAEPHPGTDRGLQGSSGGLAHASAPHSLSCSWRAFLGACGSRSLSPG